MTSIECPHTFPRILTDLARSVPRQRSQNPEVRASGKGKKRVWKADWHVYVAQPDGREKRKHRTGTFGKVRQVQKAEAQRRCDEQVMRETGAATHPHGDVTLRLFWEQVYRPVRQGRWTHNTRKAYDNDWRNHVDTALGSLRLGDVTKPAIDLHLVKLAESGLGAVTVKRAMVMIKSLLEEAAESDYIPKNPARRIVMPACKAPNPTRAMTEDEVRHLFATAPSTGDRLMLRLLILCGIRRGELLALRHRDVEGWLVIDESLSKGRFGLPKNHKVRRVPLPPLLRAELTAWMSMMPDQSPDALVFQGIRSRSHITNFEPFIARIRTASGIRDFDLRLCRRTFATLYDGDARDVADILGHSGVTMTVKAYRKPIADRQEAQVEDLEKRLM